MGESKIIYTDQVEGGIGAAVCALGVFDGVHIGHRRLIADCLAQAAELGVSSAVMTFDVDPEEVFSHGPARKLLSNEDRIAMLAGLGADYVLVQRFDETFARVDAHDFVRQTMCSCMDPAGIYVGANFHFGCGAKGDVELLRHEFRNSRCIVTGENLLEYDGAPVTATRIRDQLEAGELASANEMLGRMHGFRGLVVHGRQVGRTLGYPTANLVPTSDYVKLADGVYAAYTRVHGTWFRTSVSVGIPKTFGDIASTIEAHLIDFDEDIYDETVEICFAKRLRPMVKFDSPDALVAQIAADTEAAAALPQLS